MKRIATLFCAGVMLAAGTAAQAAEEWGIEGEQTARFEAKAVDVLCELTGDCPPDCGGGKRQMGLLTDDGKLILVAKNFDIFAGGADDLHPFCNKRIVADGLMINTPHMPVFALQFKREAPNGKWARANWFSRNWSKANGGQKGGQWFRKDAQVREIIEKGGVFGIPGLEPEE